MTLDPPCTPSEVSNWTPTVVEVCNTDHVGSALDQGVPVAAYILNAHVIVTVLSDQNVQACFIHWNKDCIDVISHVSHALTVKANQVEKDVGHVGQDPHVPQATVFISFVDTDCILPAIAETASSSSIASSARPVAVVSGRIAGLNGINPLASCHALSRTGTLSSSDAPLLVFTNTVVSVVSTSISNVSLPQPLTIALLRPSPAVSLLSRYASVVSATDIFTLSFTPESDANWLRVTSA